jgi:hypothetical protein
MCEHVLFLFVVHAAHGEHLLQTSRFHIFTTNFKKSPFKPTRCSFFIHIYNRGSPTLFHNIWCTYGINPLQNTSASSPPVPARISIITFLAFGIFIKYEFDFFLAQAVFFRLFQLHFGHQSCSVSLLSAIISFLRY